MNAASRLLALLCILLALAIAHGTAVPRFVLEDVDAADPVRSDDDDESNESKESKESKDDGEEVRGHLAALPFGGRARSASLATQTVAARSVARADGFKRRASDARRRC